MNAPHTIAETALPAPTRAAMGQSHIHESARAQVAGAAHYIDDLPEVKGTLYAAPILSTVAHGTLNGVDATAALALPGVRGVVLASDVPGDKILAAFGHDEPVFALDSVQFVGQVIGLVVADSVMQARRAVRAVKLDISPARRADGAGRAEGAKLCAAAGVCAPGRCRHGPRAIGAPHAGSV